MKLDDFDEKFLMEEGVKLREIDVNIRADVVKKLIVSKLREQQLETLRLYTMYEYIDFSSRSGAAKGTVLWIEYVANFLNAQIDEALKELEEKTCLDCGGEKGFWDEGVFKTCSLCKGKGVV